MCFLKRKSIKSLGAVPAPPDKRDHRLEEIFGASPVDWNKGYDIEKEMGMALPVKNQGSSQSCVSQAWSYYAEVLDYLETKRFLRESARFIYSQIYLPNGGAYLRAGGQILTNKGEVPEALVKDYQNENQMRNKSDITNYDLEVAQVLLKASYASFSAQSIDYTASVIKSHHGAVSGVLDDFQYNNWHKEIITPGTSRTGHALYFGKFKLLNGKKYLGFKNSWGPNFGNNGWQWLGEEWFQGRRFFDPQTIIDLPNEIERPKKKPRYVFLNNLRVGMNNAEVRVLQECLKYLGLFNYPTATGFFGGITLKAVKLFQSLHNIPATGFVGPLTRAQLNSIFK